ncbi:deoxyguanosinetriphosphate triphosphohydrolase [Pectinatus sottacetonis]|uniref:deoxyguanosinetriphosphate triphosphohydrolase n=1 Tax=Pectinatus sottacetonis TaxID=1002795 RepID=UPI0018C6162B|nr:deoxyguanosinetriphosphate triphosphohydrolase [Pectinatus sottacetonis]
MNIREKTEELEYEILSPDAAKSRDAKRSKDETMCPFRTAYQRDRDRILHSKSFRRLKHKTQVYITAGDHYRTRMTHSLEVAQISRTIARGLRLNEDLTEAIALGHDVGHTPFSHVGEEVMNALAGHFYHNEQSLRMVEYLEKNGKGLNLTIAVKDGILNHTGKVVPKTLEGRIVKTADRIAYLCHDYDDSLRSGLLNKIDLPDIVVGSLGSDYSTMITGMVSDMILSSSDKHDILLSDHMVKVMNVFRTFMFEKIYHSKVLEKERKQAGFIVEQLFKYYMKNPDKMPREFWVREKKWGKQQVVVDYIAGLTDSYAVAKFNEIFVPPVWNQWLKVY